MPLLDFGGGTSRVPSQPKQPSTPAPPAPRPIPPSQTQAPSAPPWWTYARNNGGNGSSGVPDFADTFTDNDMAAASTTTENAWIANQKSYVFPKWASLDSRTQDLFNDIAKSYYYSSTGKSWYDKQFLPYAREIMQKTGIAIDLPAVALRFAHEAGYDVTDYYKSSEVLSPNSILFDIAKEEQKAAGSSSSASGGGGYRSYGGGGGGYSGGGGSGGSSRVDLTNPTTARGLLMQTMQQVLGRNPTDKEVREFTKTLSRAETANPTTVVADATGVVQSGGTDPSMIALDYAKARDDFKSRQAGKYFNVFMNALGGGYSG